MFYIHKKSNIKLNKNKLHQNLDILFAFLLQLKNRIILKSVVITFFLYVLTTSLLSISSFLPGLINQWKDSSPMNLKVALCLDQYCLAQEKIRNGLLICKEVQCGQNKENWLCSSYFQDGSLKIPICLTKTKY